MVSRSKNRRFKGRYILYVLAALAAGFWVWSMLLGPASRFGVAKALEERYGRKFVVLSAKRAPGEALESRVFSARIYTVAPKDDRDAVFFAASYRATDGFWPVAHRYLSDSYVEDQMLRIWEEDAGGLEYTVVPSRYPLQRSEKTYHSGFYLNIDITPDSLDQVCALLSRNMERMLAETPAQPDQMTSFRFFLRYREEDWPEEETSTSELLLFYNLYDLYQNAHYEGSEWRTVDTDAGAIRQYILENAAAHARLYDLDT